MPAGISYFERLHHQGLDGEYYAAPLLLDADHRIVPETTDTLLRAADIVYVAVGSVGIAALVDDVGAMLSNPESVDGMIIEDELGAGSVTIDSQLTAVTKPNDGRYVAPTRLFFDMLYQLQQYDQ